MEYDPYGRLIRKEYVGNMYITYTYTNGLLMRETDSNGGDRGYAYDNYGRLIMDLQTIGTADHNLSRYYTYDSNGNLTSVEYSQEYGSSAMHYGTENFSYQNGQVKKISFQATPLSNAESVIWEVTSENAQGIPSTIVSGPLTHTYSYDLQTRPLQIQTLKNGITLRNMSYAYHPQTGNLLSRTDNTRNLQESFTYDHQNRLTSDGTETYEYDNATGNMTYNSRIGTITYGFGLRNSYQVNLIDPLTRTTDDIHLLTVQQKATYNAMSRPATLEESNLLLEFTYNGRCERNIAKFVQITPPQGFWDDTVKTEVKRRYYLSDIYERSVTKKENKVILYLGGNAYSAPAAFVQDSLFGAHMVYICRDHLGSITHLSSDKINEEYSYDAWGNLRNPDTHELYQTRVSKDYLYLLRGYTGHEHLGYYGLINMNARLYEPATGRFISPDPYVQMPDYSQNYNRYTYCLNNPLKYTDPSGEIAWFIPMIIGAAVGAYTGASIQSGTAAFWDWDSDSWQGAIAGAFIGASIGGFVSSGIGAMGVAATSGKGVSNVFGTATTIFNSASVNISINTISGGGWDGAWKAGLSGAVTGAWTAFGGFNLVKAYGSQNTLAQIGGKLGYQMIGTTLGSIGNNWGTGNDPFSRITLGIGPINLTLGKGEKLLQWEDNIANILTHGAGQVNRFFGGKVNWDWENLSANYSGGIVDYFFSPMNWSSGYGAHAVIGNSNLHATYSHELHHLWQSRAMNNRFLLNYGLQGINAYLRDKMPLERFNYFEQQAHSMYWW